MFVYVLRLLQFNLLQSAQNALLQHEACGEGYVADADGNIGVLGESVAAEFESWWLATPTAMLGTAHQPHPHRAVFVVPRRECSRRAGTSGSRHSVLPSAKR